MKFFYDLLQTRSTLYNAIATLLTFVVLFAVKMLINKGIKDGSRFSLETKRKLVIRLRTVVLLLFIFITGATWSNQLKAFALSLAALAAAIAIATKEFILSFCGTILKTIAQSFSHGDRIEITGIRGDVVDQTMLSTTILEIGPGNLTHQYTGRSIVIPNMLFLSNPVTNETFFHDFVLHTFTIPRHINDDIERDEATLLKACDVECGKYIANAQQDMDKRTRKKHLETMSVKPRVSLKIIDADTIELVVRVAVPFRLKGKIENAILKQFLRSIKQRAAERQFQV